MIELRLDAFDVAVLVFVLGLVNAAGKALGAWAWTAVSSYCSKCVRRPR
jgi:hypothetical protein